MTPIIGAPPVAPSPSPSGGVDFEGLVLDGLDLNDGATRSVTQLKFTPAKKLLPWVNHPDADGAKLLRAARHENSQFDLRLHIDNSTMDLALDTAGGIIDKLQEAERQAASGGRGLELVWTPMGSSYSFTFYVLAAEHNLDREEFVYRVHKPFFDVVLYTSPFGYGPEVTTSTTSSALPLLTATIEDVPGDVPAECRMIVTDAAGQNRDYVAVGLENFYYDVATSLLYSTANMVISGFAGAFDSRAGSYSVSIVRATLSTTAVVVCSSGEFAHKGSFRNVFRLYPSSDAISVRLAWRQGRDQWTTEPWATLPASAKWCEVDLGQTKIRPALLGTQSWQWRLEAKTTVAGDTLDVDFHAMVPTEYYGKARRTLAYETPTTFSARDEFDQSAGSLTGKTAPVGGVWAAGGGDTDDFTLDTSGKTAQRTAVNDTTAVYLVGRQVVVPTSLTACVVQCDLKTSSTGASGVRQGVIARWVDASNFMRVTTTAANSPHTTDYVVEVVVAGVSTTLVFTLLTPSLGSNVSRTEWSTLRVMVTAAGNWYVWHEQQGVQVSTPRFSGNRSELATGGALASGRPGIFDGCDLPSGSRTSNYDNFMAFVPTADAACFSGQSLEFRSYGDDPVLREDSTGTYWGRPPEARGGRMWLPCAGSQDRTSRVAVMARRNDIETLPSENIADSTSVAVSYRPRWVAIPRQA